MPITPLTGHANAGIAGQYTETLVPVAESIAGGDFPPIAAPANLYTVATGQDLEALTVVGLNGGGEVIPAEHGVTAAIGVLVYPMDSTGGAEDAQVYRTGNFNPDRLIWDVSYDTDAKKAAAFEGAPSPTLIFVTKTESFTAP